MSRDVSNVSGMRPGKGDTTLTLPVTFDYSGGRKDSNRSRLIWSSILAVVGVIVAIGIATSKDGSVIVNICLSILWVCLVSFIIRFPIMKEGKIRREYIEMHDNNYKYDMKKIWGIYDISPTPPYYCRFRNGQSGLFVRLNKDVILGKYSDSEYEHYEAIADALNLAGSGQVRVCHVDYMDNVGSDERLEECFVGLGEVRNQDLKELLTDMYGYLQQQMMDRVTTFDVYLFMWTGSDISAWNMIQRILACFLEANYRSYHILNQYDLRELMKTVNNLHDFSVVSAMSNAFVVSDYTGVVPINKVDSVGNCEVFNKTIQEKKEEQRQRIKEQEIRKREISRKKQQKKKDKKDDEIDLFS